MSDRADRKSTRLNSSHLVISYAVFCLKKKKKNHATVQSHVHAQFIDERKMRSLLWRRLTDRYAGALLRYVLQCIDLFFFFFNDTATTEIYTLSLHDALPI